MYPPSRNLFLNNELYAFCIGNDDLLKKISKNAPLSHSFESDTAKICGPLTTLDQETMWPKYHLFTFIG